MIADFSNLRGEWLAFGYTNKADATTIAGVIKHTLIMC